MNEEISRIDINNVNYKLKDEGTRALGEMGKQALIKVGYYVCSTQGNTAEKTISATDYTLSTGGCIKVKMENKNTANNATLNINNTGANPLFYDGERVSATNSWEAGETVEIYYDGTSYYANNVAGGSSDGVFDVSKKYPTSGVEGGNTYTLEGALAVLNTNLPTRKKKGGMSIKFIQSSDNKYVQYRLMSKTWSTNVANWQGVDDVPIIGSKNLVKSGSVYSAIRNLDIRTESIEQSKTQDETDEILITDNNSNEVLSISPIEVDAKNLKSNGKRCLTTDDINTHIDQSETQDETSEVIYVDNNNNTVLKINNNGAFDKNGNEILGSASALAGKKAIFFGDSITEGIATNDWQKQWFGGWPRLLRDNAGMIVKNNGIGGTTLRDNSQNRGICQRLIADATLNQYDYIILSGGFNDFANWSADDSVITNGYNSAFDTTKSMGALENCINYLQNNFPDKHIGFILCYDIGAFYETYYEVIVEVLEKWSMPYIDLRKESTFNLNNHGQANVYGVYEGSVTWFDSTQNYVTDDKCQYNGVVYSAKHNITAGNYFNEADWNLAPEGTHTSAPWHINVIGYRKSYPQIKSWLETL